ncbi:hypothetical protein Q3G72_008785 [Acer saccharum]|nr:hypothetical protein Q3G72_008785 [Acer saccharum]
MFHHFQQPKQQGSSIEQLAPSPSPSDPLPFRHKAWFSHCRSRPPIRISPYAWGRCSLSLLLVYSLSLLLCLRLPDPIEGLPKMSALTAIRRDIGRQKTYE